MIMSTNQTAAPWDEVLRCMQAIQLRALQKLICVALCRSSLAKVPGPVPRVCKSELLVSSASAHDSEWLHILSAPALRHKAFRQEGSAANLTVIVLL